MHIPLLLAAFLAGFMNLAVAAQADKPASNMGILADKVRADKKLIVANNMQLTEAEAKKFWPVYKAYQTDLGKLNEKIAAMILAYAKDYNSDSLTDKKAKKLINYAIAVDEADAKLKRTYLPKVTKVLPMKKAARYFQIESKIRAIIRYELAGEIPLVP